MHISNDLISKVCDKLNLNGFHSLITTELKIIIEIDKIWIQQKWSSERIIDSSKQ